MTLVDRGSFYLFLCIGELLKFDRLINWFPMLTVQALMLTVNSSMLNLQTSMLFVHSSMLNLQPSMLIVHPSMLNLQPSMLIVHPSILIDHASMLTNYPSIVTRHFLCRKTITARYDFISDKQTCSS